MMERLAIEHLHDEIVNRSTMRTCGGVEGGLTDVVHGADMRVIAGRDRLGFAREAFERVRGARLGRDHFHRHRAIETRVTAAIDLAHAARAERRDDLVRPEACARCERHVARLYERTVPDDTIARDAHMSLE